MSTEIQPLLQVRNLRTWFHTFTGTVKAVNGVSFDLAEGEVMGLVGESGGGKSVVGYSLLGLIDPPGKIEGGSILFAGEELANAPELRLREIRGREIAMIFQDPMTALNPVHSIGRQMDEMLCLHTDLDKAARRKACIDMLESVGISQASERLDSYPHQFSGGMRQRVVIAIAMLAKPRLIIADEPTTALDVTIQAQILDLLVTLREKTGMALVLITHNMGVVAETAERVVVQYAGQQVERQSVRDLFRTPRHPYTAALLSALPDRANGARLLAIPGVVPGLIDRPTGCLFNPRCSRADDKCRTVAPPRQGPDMGEALCHYPVQTQEAAA